MDKKFFTPSPLKQKMHFRERAEEFTDFVGTADETVSNALDRARDSPTPFMSLGNTPEQIAGARLFPIVRKLMEHPAGRTLVVHAPNKCIWGRRCEPCV